jgi:hypothetical protein
MVAPTCFGITLPSSGPLPEGGNVMPKHVGSTIHDYQSGLVIGVFVGFSRTC